LESRIEDGWVSSCYGQREPAPVALFQAQGDGPEQFVSFLIPPKPCTSGSLWPPRIEEGPRDAQEGAATERRSYRVFLISAGESRDVVMLGAGESHHLTQERVTAAGSMAWARFIAGGFTRGCLIAGKSFEVAQGLAFHSPTTVRCCGFQIDDEQIKITIHGGRQFGLSFYNPPNRIVVNNSSFDLAPGCLRARFALEDSGWKLVDKD